MGVRSLVERFRYGVNRLGERLWVKPMIVGVISIAGVVLAKTADRTRLDEIVPVVSTESVDALLTVMASSMLVIATFAVGSMIAAYSSASNTASPRSFLLVVSDDISQRALSTFIGAFIFSIVGLVAVTNEFFDSAGRFVLFLFTLGVFGAVIVVFVRWVDRVARLGRLGNTIRKVEQATAKALTLRRAAPTLGALPAGTGPAFGFAVAAPRVGYVQRIDVSALQSCAEDVDGRIRVVVLPGSFVDPSRTLAYVGTPNGTEADLGGERVSRAFLIGEDRVFDYDPRYGLVVLSQIAGRALSPAVNDPGTAIDIIGILVRLFVAWASPQGEDAEPDLTYDRVEVPALSVDDMFDDAFTAIIRDGSGSVQVAIRAQKALRSLAAVGDPRMREAALRHARAALTCAEQALVLDEDVGTVRELARFAEGETGGEADGR